MLRSIVSSIEFEKFRRNWSEKNSMKRFLRKRLNSAQRFPELSVSLLGSLEVNSASHSPWVVRQVVSQSTMKFASCDDDLGNSVNAYLWVGVQGVVALSLLFAPIFLR
ncbi:hypothetical protein [Leptospira noguchii]|uniref:hypothetical protein n=1 Tax=Leptospira noguchii TaxID=28182 RepID=UPI001FB5D2CB|nr:hypothetical protein [Leptospira noguchii]UOG54587.1 hypothetical protein MAL09_20320 [Leptospira noguchii]